MTAGLLLWGLRWETIWQLILLLKCTFLKVLLCVLLSKERKGLAVSYKSFSLWLVALLERLWRGWPLHTWPGTAEYDRPDDSKVGTHILYHNTYYSIHTRIHRHTVFTLLSKKWNLRLNFLLSSSLPASQSVLCAACTVSWCFLPPSKWRRGRGISAGYRGKQEEDGGGCPTGEQRRERLQCSPKYHIHTQSTLL